MSKEEDLFYPDDERLDEIADRMTQNDKGIKDLEQKLKVAAYFSIVKQKGETLTITIPRRKAAAISLHKGSFVNVMIGRG